MNLFWAIESAAAIGSVGIRYSELRKENVQRFPVLSEKLDKFDEDKSEQRSKIVIP